MKVLYLASVYPRWLGDATPPFVQNQAELIAAEGHEVLVLAPHAKGAKIKEAGGGVAIRRFPYAWPFGLQKLCYDGGMLVNLRYRPWTRLLLPFFLLSEFIWTLLSAIRLRPDVIHSHSLLPQGLVAAWVAWLVRVPHVTTSHGNDVFGLKSVGLSGRLKKWVLKQADAITVNSSVTEKAVLDLGASVGKVFRIPAVPNESPVQPELVASIQDRYPAKKRILFVGRLIEEKGPEDLIRAFARLEPGRSDYSCILVGEGPLKAQLEALAEELGVAKQVHFPGWQPRGAVPSWMAAADVLVVPSKPVGTWVEAQGLVVVEAMLVKLAVVASNFGGICDMISNGDTGCLFEAGDEPALFQSLIYVLENDRMLEKISGKAQKMAYRGHSSDSIKKATLKLYEAVQLLRMRSDSIN